MHPPGRLWEQASRRAGAQRTARPEIQTQARKQVRLRLPLLRRSPARCAMHAVETAPEASAARNSSAALRCRCALASRVISLAAISETFTPCCFNLRLTILALLASPPRRSSSELARGVGFRDGGRCPPGVDALAVPLVSLLFLSWPRRGQSVPLPLFDPVLGIV